MTIKDEADRLRELAAAVPCEQVSDLQSPLNEIRSAVHYILPDPEILGFLESVDAAIASVQDNVRVKSARLPEIDAWLQR